MERRITIKYSWWRVDQEPIDDEHMVALEERAEKYVFKAIADGWTEGMFEDSIRMHDTDPEEGVEYHGSWEWTRARSMSSNIAADRLYLLWSIKEQVFSGMDGSVSMAAILDNILNLMASSPIEMMASDEEKRHLQSEGPERIEESMYPAGTEEEVS